MIGPLVFLLFANDLSNVINVTTLLFADDVKMVSPHSHNDFLHGSVYNMWDWAIKWNLPITPTNYMTNGRTPPLQLFLATGSLSNSIQIANVKNLVNVMDNYFSPSIHCKEVASKARLLLFGIRGETIDFGFSST